MSVSRALRRRIHSGISTGPHDIRRIETRQDAMTLFARKSRKPRRTTERQAWLVKDRDFALHPCTVVDMSDDGARLRLANADRLPQQFRLTFSRATRNGRRCEMRWRRGQSVGVKFVA
jgi:hypothetical protein